MRAADNRVLQVLVALALSACASTRQHAGVDWAPTTLKQRELDAAKAAVAEVADTHVFDWNTATAQRRGDIARLLVEALPEPQADGSVAEPVADCFGARDGWDCKVSVVRSLRLQIDIDGARRGVVALVEDGVATADAATVVRETFDVLPTLGAAHECADAVRSALATPETLRLAFEPGATEFPVLVARDGERIYVRSLAFNLDFVADARQMRRRFECWSYAPIG